MAIRIREATVMAAMVFLATAHPAQAEKGTTPNGIGQGATPGSSDDGSQGGGGDAKGTPAPIAGLGIGALAALGYFVRRLRARKEI
ncbi:hypothetical protein [Rhizorhabdus argentea]|uniref:hypothetical protein n=1 Tax=Rhizorhabdus argentea TaxID=1387174 RepID=UPI0030ED5092